MSQKLWKFARVKSFVDPNAPSIGQHDLDNAQDIQRITESIVMLTNEGQSSILQHYFEEWFSSLRQTKNWMELTRWVHPLPCPDRHLFHIAGGLLSTNPLCSHEWPCWLSGHWPVTRLHTHALEGILTAQQWSIEGYWRRAKGRSRGGQWWILGWSACTRMRRRMGHVFAAKYYPDTKIRDQLVNHMHLVEYVVTVWFRTNVSKPRP